MKKVYFLNGFYFSTLEKAIAFRNAFNKNAKLNNTQPFYEEIEIIDVF